METSKEDVFIGDLIIAKTTHYCADYCDGCDCADPGTGGDTCSCEDH